MRILASIEPAAGVRDSSPIGTSMRPTPSLFLTFPHEKFRARRLLPPCSSFSTAHLSSILSHSGLVNSMTTADVVK